MPRRDRSRFVNSSPRKVREDEGGRRRVRKTYVANPRQARGEVHQARGGLLADSHRVSLGREITVANELWNVGQTGDLFIHVFAPTGAAIYQPRAERSAALGRVDELLS